MRNENQSEFNKADLFCQITDQMTQTYAAKNHDYGGSFSHSMEEFGLIAAVVRLNDKMERLKTFAKLSPDQMKVKDESVQDTLLDLANYAVMTLVELKSKK